MNAKDVLTPYFVRDVPENSVYKARIEEEFTLIDKFGFTKVFQQVHDILEIAERLHIPHIIRGSSGSSLICFLMGITQIDPILYGLELARFMNHGRRDLPDIDMDVPYNRREELYQEICKKWPKMVARISNHVTYGHKVALRETAKQHLLESMPENPELRDPEDKQKLRKLNRRHFNLEKIVPDEAQRTTIQEEAKKKVGTMKHYSKHCAGIVIFEEEGEVPEELLLDSSSELQQIKLNKDETEDQGYIKIDILSSRGLAQLITAQQEPQELLAYPSRDPLTEKLLASGKNLGITFGESRGMRKLFMGMKPRHMDDVAIVLALIRPAAATRGRKAEFLQRWRHGAENLFHPLERQIIFDDDAITLIRDAIGCDAAEADRWRKVFAKSNANGRLEFRRLLYQKGVPRKVQDHIMEELDYLALYSFCKSHAVSYAQLVWALAYEKAHNPHRFWLGALNHCHSEYRKWVHYREARCSGILLSREKPPYKLGTRHGQPALVSVESQGEQQLLSQMFSTLKEDPKKQSIDELKQYGYWLSKDFLPNCGVWPVEQQKLEHWFGSKKQQAQISVKFRGLIAASRILRRDGLVTLFTIGVENERYVDIVIPDKARDDLYSWAILEGKGIYENHHGCETITVESIKGVSLQSLLTI